MEYRNLGTAGIKVSPICLGTGFRAGLHDATCRATIEHAIDLGVNFIDCANGYHRGRSEQLVGRVLKGRRNRFVVTSKVSSAVGDGPNDRGLSRVHILREVNQSLSRLQTDYLDLYLLHHPDPTTPIEETLRALDDLVRQGKVRYIGCSRFAAWQVCKALWLCDRCHLVPYICVQDRYSLFDRSLEGELMPLCGAEGLGMMAFSPLAIGLLTGRFRHGVAPPADTLWGQKKQRRFEQMMPPAADHVVEALRRIGVERGKTPAQVALAWVLSHAEISVAIIGPDCPEQVEENVGGTGWELAANELELLDEVSAWATKM